MQPDCRAGLWATAGLWARPTRPIRQGKTPGLEGPLPFSLAPPSPHHAPALCSLCFNARFRRSPQSEVSRGLKNRGEKKNKFVDFFSLLVLGCLPPWPPALLMNKRKVRIHHVPFAAAAASRARYNQHFCATYPADRSPLASPRPRHPLVAPASAPATQEVPSSLPRSSGRGAGV